MVVIVEAITPTEVEATVVTIVPTTGRTMVIVVVLMVETAVDALAQKLDVVAAPTTMEGHLVVEMEEDALVLKLAEEVAHTTAVARLEVVMAVGALVLKLVEEVAHTMEVARLAEDVAVVETAEDKVRMVVEVAVVLVDRDR
jgi:hypothetical protein